MSKNLSTAEHLRDLYELQLIDSELHEIEIIKGELPMEVEDLEDEMVGLKTRAEKLKSDIAGLEEELQRHLTNIKEAEANIERYTKQMDNVANNREFDALTKELELQKIEIQLSNKKIKEKSYHLEKRQDALKLAEKKIEKKEKEFENKKVELEKIASKTEKQQLKLERKRKRAAKKLPEHLQLSYDKIKGTYKNGLAVVHIERDSCGGCHNAIPPQVQIEIAQRKNIIVCESCGRILVDENILLVGTEEEA